MVVRTADRSIDADLVDRIVAEVKPAHVHHTVEVVATGRSRSSSRSKAR